MLELTDAQRGSFDDDGYVVVKNVLTEAIIPPLHERYERLFRGEFETCLMPDEVNWQAGRDDQRENAGQGHRQHLRRSSRARHGTGPKATSV